MQFRVIVVTDPQTHPHTHINRQDQLQYTVPQLVRSVKNKAMDHSQWRKMEGIGMTETSTLTPRPEHELYFSGAGPP